ncbi:MAG TPA: hypothetical protein VFI24_21775 [Pyrinomonadaceae bacterium]|nr:hypothetical protein [Pyrinomonadaceae bacterium]
MSTKPVRVGKPAEPMTPIIIKSGGGSGGVGGDLDKTSRASSVVEITTEKNLFFFETAQGLRWESSQTELVGRITGLSITDGEKQVPVPDLRQTGELACVTLMYGLDQLMVMESGVPAQNDVVLVITSPQIPFDVPKMGDWAGSKTTFPSQITSVTLTVGHDVSLLHECKTSEVIVTITFDQNPT